MKAIRQFVGGISLCLLEAVTGILLIIDPVMFTSGIIIACGILLLVWALFSILRYFRTEAEEAAAGHDLTKGLGLLVLGGFCILRSDWFLLTFPLLTFAYGIVILAAGLGKIQWTVDMFRTKRKRWFLGTASAAISILCAAVILRNPFASTEVLWMFTGISLVCEAFLDIITFFISGGKKEEPQLKEEIIEAEEETV